jgi:segregation and condensation protein A
MLESAISVKLDKFDGPLALLLHLIQKDEVDIRELDIVRVTSQYIHYLQKMQDLNFDIAGEYLYMAATLLYLKSRVCIEDPSESIILKEEDLEIKSKSELIKKLEELEKFQRLGERLWAMDKKGHEVFLKPKTNRKAIVDSILTPLDLNELTMAMIDLMKREKRKFAVMRRDRLSIKEKLIELKSKLKVGQKTTLSELYQEDKGIIDVVITFISLLELARLKKVNIFQNEDRGHVYVDPLNELDNFDVDTANGFEAEGEEQEMVMQ